MTTEHDLTTALEAYIGEIVDQKVDDKLDAELLAENIKDLEDFIGEQITKSAQEFEIEADDVIGLEHAIEKEVENQIESMDINAGDIRNLDSEIRDVLDEWDFSQDDKLMDTVRQKAQECLEKNISDAVAEVLKEIPITVSIENISNFEDGVKHYLQENLDGELDRALAKPDNTSLEWFYDYISKTVEERLVERRKQFLQRISPLHWLQRLFNVLCHLHE